MFSWQRVWCQQCSAASELNVSWALERARVAWGEQAIPLCRAMEGASVKSKVTRKASRGGKWPSQSPQV